MKTITVPLSEATPAQMRQFATETLGLAIKQSDKPEAIRAKVAAAWDKENIVITEKDAPAPVTSAPVTSAPASTAPVSAAPAAPPAAAAPPVDLSQGSPRMEEYVLIFIDKTDDAGGDQPVPVSVNGRNMWIERGKPQRVKRKYEHALGNALRVVYDQPDGPRSAPVAREVPSYPYRILSDPAPAV